MLVESNIANSDYRTIQLTQPVEQESKLPEDVSRVCKIWNTCIPSEGCNISYEKYKVFCSGISLDKKKFLAGTGTVALGGFIAIVGGFCSNFATIACGSGFMCVGALIVFMPSDKSGCCDSDGY